MSNPPNLDPGAVKLLEALKDEARKWIEVTGNVEIEPYQVGPSGNFPWYFQAGQDFNAITYDWIIQAPTTQDGVVSTGGLDKFATQYRDIIRDIAYRLSKDEQAQLDKYNNDNAAATSNLVNQWTKTYGRFDDDDLDGNTPIDLIFQKILTTWTTYDPKNPITITDLVDSNDLGSVLTNIPASGYPLLGAIGTYLGASGLNARALNKKVTANGELKSIFTALTKLGDEPPKKKPLVPGIEADMHLSDKRFGLMWKINPTTNELKGTVEDDRREFTFIIDILHESDKTASVSVSGGARFSCPIGWLFGLSVGGSSSYFSSKVYKKSEKINIKVTFKGLTTAYVLPEGYDSTSRRGWFWKTPVSQAIGNIGQKDPSGYCFTTDESGSKLNADKLGYISVVAFCQQPDFEITVTTSDYARIEKELKTSTSVGVTFFGIPLGLGAGADSYDHQVNTDSTNSTVTIKLPTPRTVEVRPEEQTAWILGVDTEYPFQKAASRAAMKYVQNAAAYSHKPAFVDNLFKQFSLKHEDQPTIHRKPAPPPADDEEEKKA